MNFSGLFVLDKPEGITSFDVVARVRRRLKTRRVGHTGTLDPMATGVLPICVGSATRVARFLAGDSKTYLAEVQLGASTDTQDRLGRIVKQAEVPLLSRADIEAALAKFRGPQEQIPPMFSAVQVNGQRLYDLARQGIEVERTARQVNIHEIECLDITPTTLRLKIDCSKGTYVRTLAHDLGEQLGCHGHLSSLRRLRAGSFTLDGALTLEELDALPDAALAQRGLSEREALRSLPEIQVEPPVAFRVENGQKMSVESLPGLREQPEGTPLKITEQETNRLLAVVQRQGETLCYLRVLSELPAPEIL